jgi:histone-lysine N-methyltransferase SUV39H
MIKSLWIIFKNSYSCFYIKCVADEKQKNPNTSKNSLKNKVKSLRKRKILKANCDPSKIKIYRCNEESLDNIDAELSCTKKCILENDDESSVNSKDSTFSVSQKENSMFETDASSNSGQGDFEISNRDQNNVQKVTNFDNSSSRYEADDAFEIDPKNSIVGINEKSNDSFHSNSTICSSSSTVANNNNINRYYQNRELNDVISDNIFSLERNLLDTAFITIPYAPNNKFEVTFNYMTSDERIKCFILEGGMIEPNDYSDAYDPSEIEEIINDVLINGIHYYLIKWKIWSRGFNTWERFGSLYKSQKLYIDYMKKKNNEVDIYKPINGIHLMLSRKVISKLFNMFRTETGLSLPLISPEDLSNIFNCLDIGSRKSQIQRKKCLKFFLTTISLGSFRQQQLLNLNQWEIDINLVTKKYKIKVENNIDLEGPPDLFVYVCDYIPRNNIIIPNDPPIGCNCKKNCQYSNECCNELSGCETAYDANKNIILAPRNPVYECNKKCKCTVQCNNRVVQLGSEVEVCIYKTKEYGWGVKTRQTIQKGQFIASYVGEIITVEESEQRLENNFSSMDYMWNLDFNDQKNYKYIIDGSHYANFTYFINHSCNANLDVYAVWINCLDRNLPQLALFSNRTISAGEQLTTNYFSRSSPATLKRSGIRCQCNMKNCKGYYF